MIDFVKKRRLWYTVSVVIIGIGIGFMMNNVNRIGHVFNLGIDFTGGTSLSLQFKSPQSMVESRLTDVLNQQGFLKHMIQLSENNTVILKLSQLNVQQRNQVLNGIESEFGAFELLEVDIIGPSIGEELRNTSIIILIAVSIAILMYCSWRFDFLFGVSSIVALLHDAIVLISLTAIFKIEVNTAYIAAMLTVLGYSINDTIVIFDRIREKLTKKDDDLTISKSSLNQAIVDMLPRSIHTSITTGLVVGSLFFIAGESLQVFSTILMIGLIVGTYSSICIASPVIVTVSKIKGVSIVK